jgi:hypothetical protein
LEEFEVVGVHGRFYESQGGASPRRYTVCRSLFIMVR